MANKRLEVRRRSGETMLESWGVGVSATVAELEACLGRSPDADLAIASRLGASSQEPGGVLLRRLEESADKEVRKEAKRSLYRLEQRGVEVPEKTRSPRKVSVTAAMEGYLSAFDGRGDRLVWLVKPGTGGVLHLFAVVNDPAGLREVAINRLTRKSLREIQRELGSKHDIRFVAMDWRRVDSILNQGVRWAREHGTATDGDYAALRARLTVEPVLAAEPLSDDAVSATVDAEALGASAELLLEPEFRTWLLDRERAESVVEEMVEIRDSPLVLNEVQVQERFNQVYHRVVGETFGGERRESWARRLAEMSYYFEETKRAKGAAGAAAVALALRQGGEAAEIPFCAIYVRRTIGMLVDETKKKEEDQQQSSLIVTPGQARRDR